MIDLMLRRAAEAGVPLTAEQAAKFETYHKMLVAANAQFNLTRVPDDITEAVDRNYLDCIAPLKNGFPIDVSRAIDVGSGAGFPGIPLSICLPDVHFVLLDSLGKRVDFLKSVISALNLNAEAIHMRAEDAAKLPELRERFDIATARAVASFIYSRTEMMVPGRKTSARRFMILAITSTALSQACRPCGDTWRA